MRKELMVLLLAFPAFSQHGVIREYAALAPRPDAVALKPLLNEPLTDVSITHGAGNVFYMTGSAAGADGAVSSRRVAIWQSGDLKEWRKVRTLDLDVAVRSPEIHSLKGMLWLTLGIEGGGTELLRFDSPTVADSTFRRARITAKGEDPSLFLDDDGSFYWVMGAGEVARMKPDPMEGLAAEPRAVIAPLTGDLRSSHMRGAFLAKVQWLLPSLRSGTALTARRPGTHRLARRHRRRFRRRFPSP